MSNRSLLIVVIVVILVGGIGYLLFLQPNQFEPIEVDGELQNEDSGLVFTTTAGVSVTIDDLLEADKPLIIYFFTTWCSTCRKDLENLNTTYPQHKDEISIFVVSFDPTETPDRIRNYKEGRNYPWPFAEYSKDAIIEFQIVYQASKVGISLDNEVVFTEGFGIVSEDGWKELFQLLT